MKRARVTVHYDREGVVELDVDGTFASQYQPGRLLTGSVWDALAAPAVLLAPPERRDLLLLGLGGGSVARLLRALAPDARIVGVEISPEVVRAAREHLDLDGLGLEIVIASAHDFLAEDRGRYDMIVEDCFVPDAQGELRKPAFLPLPGLRLAARRLRRAGVLVCDTVHETAEAERALAALLPHGVRITLEECYNQVLVASRRPVDARRLRGLVQREPLLSPALGNLRFRTRSR